MYPEMNRKISRRIRKGEAMRAYHSFFVLAFLGMLLLAGCSNNPAQTQPQPAGPSIFKGDRYSLPINHPIASTGCGKAPPAQVGTSLNVTIPEDPAVANGAHTRMYVVHIPRTYDPQRPQALILILHGAGGSAVGTAQGNQFTSLGDQQDFFAVYPQGLLSPVGSSFWASEGPMDEGIDDTRYISDVLNDMQRQFCVDPHRIYETGYSNGGIMSWFLACRLAGRIAAFSPISGVSYDIPGGCHPGRSVSLLDFHGSADTLESYTGNPVPAWPSLPIPDTLRVWAARDGCNLQPEVFLNQPQFLGERWTHCQQGAEVAHYVVIGGGHGLPPFIGSQSIASLTWAFFQAHPLP